jgi:hypothetical protein
MPSAIPFRAPPLRGSCFGTPTISPPAEQVAVDLFCNTKRYSAIQNLWLCRKFVNSLDQLKLIRQSKIVFADFCEMLEAGQQPRDRQIYGNFYNELNGTIDPPEDGRIHVIRYAAAKRFRISIHGEMEPVSFQVGIAGQCRRDRGGRRCPLLLKAEDGAGPLARRKIRPG